VKAGDPVLLTDAKGNLYILLSGESMKPLMTDDRWLSCKKRSRWTASWSNAAASRRSMSRRWKKQSRVSPTDWLHDSRGLKAPAIFLTAANAIPVQAP